MAVVEPAFPAQTEAVWPKGFRHQPLPTGEEISGSAGSAGRGSVDLSTGHRSGQRRVDTDSSAEVYRCHVVTLNGGSH